MRLRASKLKMLPLVKSRIYATFAQFYVFVLGAAGGVCLFSVLPLLLFRYGVSVTDYQRTLAILSAPWSSQALIGAISDTFPVHEWHKKNYLIGALSALSVALIGAGVSASLLAVTGWLFVCSCSAVVIITLMQGHSAHLIRYFSFPSDLIPFAYGCEMLGNILAAVIVGFFAQSHRAEHTQVAFFIAVPFVLQGLYPLLVYPRDAFPGDHRTLDKDDPLVKNGTKPVWFLPVTLRTPCTTNEWRLVWILSALGAVCMMLVSLTAASEATAPIILLVTAIAIAGVFYTYPTEPVFYCACSFILLRQLVTVNINAAVDGFYVIRDSPLCTTGGPQFGVLFYYTTISALSGVTGVASAWFYKKVLLGRFTIRSITQAAIIIGMIGSLFDVCIALNLNKTIPDSVVFLIGSGVVSPVGNMLIDMAMVLLVSQRTSDRPTTQLAVYFSFKNLGTILSYLAGLLLTVEMGVTADLDVGCQYEQFARLVLVAEFVMPVFAIALTCVLLPNTK